MSCDGKNNSPLIVLTGGGSAGHVSSHLHLIDVLYQRGWQIVYMGSRSGMERRLVCEMFPKLRYVAVSTGKLRRYISWRNFLDAFKTFCGICEGFVWMMRLRPQVVLSRGGYVSFPCSVGAWFARVPVVLLEIDLRPGLAARMSFPIIQKVLYAFADTRKYLPSRIPSIMTGVPLAAGVTQGKSIVGYDLCGFSRENKDPVILVMGGSQGAQFLHMILARDGELLLRNHRLVVLAGFADICRDVYLQKLLHIANGKHRCKIFDYLRGDLFHIYAMADYVITRGGAHSLFELLSCRIPMMVVPLMRGSRGDQLENAQSFAQQGLAHVVLEDQLDQDGSLLEHMRLLFAESSNIQKRMLEHQRNQGMSSVESVIDQMGEYFCERSSKT